MSKADFNETADEMAQGGPAIADAVRMLERLHPVTRWRVLSAVHSYFAAAPDGLRRPTALDGAQPKEPAADE